MPYQSLQTHLEAILFFKGEPMKIKNLAATLEVPEASVKEALIELKGALNERGVRLIEEGEYVALATAPEAQASIEKLKKEELEGPLGKAGLETLAIIIYQGPVSRADIEYVRGVNCTSILRSLTMRGLVERIENPNDKRSFLYRATPELPAALGVNSLKELPEFESVGQDITTALEQKTMLEEEES